MKCEECYYASHVIEESKTGLPKRVVLRCLNQIVSSGHVKEDFTKEDCLYFVTPNQHYEQRTGKLAGSPYIDWSSR